MNVKPHIPVWAEKGCVTLDEWQERRSSGAAKYTRIRIKYRDKKNKEQIATKQVIWDK